MSRGVFGSGWTSCTFRGAWRGTSNPHLGRGERTVLVDAGATFDAVGRVRDHLRFHSPTARAPFAGDPVFANGAFGRTDLPGGDRSTLVASIDRVLATVDGSLSVVHPGHDPSVTDRPYDDVELARRAARLE